MRRPPIKRDAAFWQAKARFWEERARSMEQVGAEADARFEALVEVGVKAFAEAVRAALSAGKAVP